MNNYVILSQPAAFDNAVWFCWTVEVWQDGETLATGKIVSHTEHSIRLDDGFSYLKNSCEFGA